MLQQLCTYFTCSYIRNEQWLSTFAQYWMLYKFSYYSLFIILNEWIHNLYTFLVNSINNAKNTSKTKLFRKHVDMWFTFIIPWGFLISMSGAGPLSATVTSLRLGSKGICHVLLTPVKWSVDNRWTFEDCTASSTHLRTYSDGKEMWRMRKLHIYGV